MRGTTSIEATSFGAATRCGETSRRPPERTPTPSSTRTPHPKVGSFNQSKELWLGLEDHVLEYARENGHRITVFTGPVLEPDDATYRGIAIPQSFWKVAAWTTADDESNSARHAAGFVLDQRPQLEDIDLSEARASALASGNPPPLGPYRTYQVPIADIGRLTRLDVELLS